MLTNQRIRILIVGHDGSFRSKLRQLVETNQSAQVIGQVSSGEQTLASALSERPDLVLMDMAVSGSNGLVVTRQLKSQRPTIPVILFTCLDAREYLGVARFSGVDRCLNKQKVEQELPLLIEAMAGKQHNNASSR